MSEQIEIGTCEVCVFSSTNNVHNGLECRRNAPRPAGYDRLPVSQYGQDEYELARWPTVQWYHWCGEFVSVESPRVETSEQPDET